jgi:D-serine dehydratase
VRDDAQLEAVVAAIGRHAGTLQLAGIEIYEGVIADEQAVRSFLRRAVQTTRTLAAAGKFARAPAVLSGAGSAWYDVVAEEFAAESKAGEIEVVLRPGCYLTHDVGVYKKAQTEILARNPIAKKMGEALLPALQLWAYIQAMPRSTPACRCPRATTGRARVRARRVRSSRAKAGK